MDKWLFYQRGGEQEGEETGEEEEEEGEGARLLSRWETGRASSSGSTPTRRDGLGARLRRDVERAAEDRADRRCLRTVPEGGGTVPAW